MIPGSKTLSKILPTKTEAVDKTPTSQIKTKEDTYTSKTAKPSKYADRGVFHDTSREAR
jgi:hypothetical protein